MKKVILIVAIVLLCHGSVWADCELDAVMAARCQDEYTSGVKVCTSMHPNPLDASDLRMCLMYSQDVYNKCMAWVYQSPCSWW